MYRQGARGPPGPPARAFSLPPRPMVERPAPLTHTCWVDVGSSFSPTVSWPRWGYAMAAVAAHPRNHSERLGSALCHTNHNAGPPRGDTAAPAMHLVLAVQRADHTIGRPHVFIGTAKAPSFQLKPHLLLCAFTKIATRYFVSALPPGAVSVGTKTHTSPASGWPSAARSNLSPARCLGSRKEWLNASSCVH
jgi:hypothetical protein